jgi:hypothetical protein
VAKPYSVLSGPPCWLVDVAETDQHLPDALACAVLLEERLNQLLLGQQPALDEQPAQRNLPLGVGVLLLGQRAHQHPYRPKTSVTTAPGITQTVGIRVTQDA